MTRVSSHVLDTALGQPAASVEIRFERLASNGGWTAIAQATTGPDGRAADLAAGAALDPGTYRLTFETAAYFARTARAVFFPRVEVVFRVEGTAEHYHVPLLVSPFGYTTYRGS
jgi:5-hydroxyisourate hydrolase